MKIRTAIITTAFLAAMGATTVAHSEGAPTGQSMQNNSGNKTPDEQDTNKRSMAPNNGQPAPAMNRTTGSGTNSGMKSGMGTTNTDSGRASPDEQDTSRGKGPSTAKPPVGSK